MAKNKNYTVEKFKSSPNPAGYPVGEVFKEQGFYVISGGLEVDGYKAGLYCHAAFCTKTNETNLTIVTMDPRPTEQQQVLDDLLSAFIVFKRESQD